MPKKADSIPDEFKPAAAVIAEGGIPRSQLVTAAITLKEQIRDALKNLAEVEARLLQLAPGKHSGNAETHIITVFAAVPSAPGKLSYALDAADEKTARDLTDAEFGNLFDRKVSYAPCEGFAAVAPKLLTPGKAEKLLTLCQVTGKGYAGRGAYVGYPDWLKPEKADKA